MCRILPTKILSVLALPGLLLVAGYLYWDRGLTGPFLFDDFAHLPVLADLGGVRNTDTLLRFLFSAPSGPSGRFLSLLSFLIDDNSWPSEPRQFKRTNLLLHLLNGCLLYWLVFRLALSSRKSSEQSNLIAFGTMAFWLLHPMNVSTVLYIVQRMAILSATFVLTGLLVYCAVRSRIPSQSGYGYELMSAAIPSCTLLAIACKENGILLPALILALEYGWFRRHSTITLKWRWELVFLWLPSAAVGGILIRFGILSDAYATRDFTLIERLYTESYTLIDYLTHWIIPFLTPRGIFADGAPVFRQFFSPPLPALSTGLLLAIGYAAWRARGVYPGLTTAICFFFTGHLLESTVLPLETYFEHRNYLPAMLLFLPAAMYGTEWSTNRRLTQAAFAALLLGMAFTTHRLAGIWGDELKLALSWARLNPDSARAQGWAADILAMHDRSSEATRLLKSALERRPGQVQLRLDYTVRACLSSELSANDRDELLRSMRHYQYQFRNFSMLEAMYARLPSSDCQQFDFPFLHALLDAMRDNQNAANPAVRRQIHQLRGILFSREGQGPKALAEFAAAWKLDPVIESGLGEVAILAQYGHYAEALALLTDIKQLPQTQQDTSLHRNTRLDYPSEIARLEATLRADLAATPRPTGTTPDTK